MSGIDFLNICFDVYFINGVLVVILIYIVYIINCCYVVDLLKFLF